MKNKDENYKLNFGGLENLRQKHNKTSHIIKLYEIDKNIYIVDAVKKQMRER